MKLWVKSRGPPHSAPSEPPPPGAGLIAELTEKTRSREPGYLFSDLLFGLTEEITPQSEAVRVIADELFLAAAHRGHRGAAICSVAPGEGVTFVAANLAISMAVAGHATLLVEANLRAPALAGLIQPVGEPGPGLGEFLVDLGVNLEEIVHRDVLPSLSIVYAGAPCDAVLLSTKRFRQFVEEGMREFDFTIIEAPAANQFADGLTVASAAGAALIVAKNNLTFLDDIATLAQDLERAGAIVLGTALNDPN